MNRRRPGYCLLVFSALAAVCALAGWHPPVLEIPFLAGKWAGWILLAGLAFLGARLAFSGPAEFVVNPLTRKKLARFRSIRRGWVSFLLLVALAGVAGLDSLLVGKRALVVSHAGELRFPFLTGPLPEKTFGGTGESETDYRALKTRFALEGKRDWLVMPPVPFATKLDSSEVVGPLDEREGRVFVAGTSRLFTGFAHTVFREKLTRKRMEWRFKDGLRDGDLRGWDITGEQVEKGRYAAGQRTQHQFYGTGKPEDLDVQALPGLRQIVYPPSPPSWRDRHFLGTDAAGNDVLAQLFGGLQMAIVASVLFLGFTFGLGIVAGSAMGYYGGWLDLAGQRLIEIWSNVPFLFVIMLLTTLIQPNLIVLVAVVAAFSWMDTAGYLRTGTYRERERDYVAAARLLGASPARIIFSHVLPNVIATVVTLLPFKIAGIIISLAALDFLGFGLPAEEPSWGRLLHEGTENMNAPWIVASAFGIMVSVLVLVTFVGEAIREAFDPKKFTTYQ